MPLRVVAYCRVSTDQEDQRNSLQNQKQFFEAYITQNPDWELVDIYADEGITGTSVHKRKEFLRMIAAAENGAFDLILTKEVSRFSRNTIDTIAHTRRMHSLGVGIVFINDGIDTRDRDGELRLTIMASIAQEESRKTSERTKWGQKRSMERGVVFGNNSTYGYETQDGALTIRPQEAAVIRQIYHKFLCEGKGTHVIARELYEAGIATPKARQQPWSSAMIHRILCNEKYCGDLLQKKYVTLDFLSHKKIRNRGQEAHIYLRNHHEAIVSRTIFDQTQQELHRRAPHSDNTQRYSNRYWCSGKIRCGHCGSHFVLRKANRQGGAVYRSWCCHARAQYGNWKPTQAGDKVGCNMRMLNDKTLTDCVCYVLQQLAFDTDALRRELLLEIASLCEPVRDNGAQAALLRQMRMVQQKKENMMDAYFSEAINKSELEIMKQRYDAEIAGLEQQLATQEKTQNTTSPNFASLSNLQLQALLFSEEVFHEVIEQIAVYSAYIEITVRFLPMRFRLWYEITGRGKTYQTIIQRCALVSLEDAQ